MEFDISEAESVALEQHFDARITALDLDAGTVDLEANGSLMRYTLSPSDSRLRYLAAGQVGQLCIRDGGFWFWPYLDQRLRRAPQHDDPGEHLWAWTLSGSPGLILAKQGIVPGKGGCVVPDETEPVEIQVPPEFAELCSRVGLDPGKVLRGFIADLCGISSFQNCPREDGYSSNGSDERHMAASWFERAYCYRACPS